ncbi:hypothetical protein CPB83DRAFT_891745 [Crepidotus variabilis]|uniref:Uncharacterized protein n=1 Tax=Crepidotus variabilis TaxID=179855 RepID=A0A9P6EKD1_9AGAR|nr:hypothetical protein CPB83DRAFT_891745 [Crepidotus variabilis]
MAVSTTPLTFMTSANGELLSLSQWIPLGTLSIKDLACESSLTEQEDHLPGYFQFTVAGLGTVFVAGYTTNDSWLPDLKTVRFLLSPCDYSSPRLAVRLLHAMGHIGVLAVSLRSPFIKAAFPILLLLVGGGATIVLPATTTTALRIEPTEYCLAKLNAPYWVILILAELGSFFDLMVCVAVTYKIQV